MRGGLIFDIECESLTPSKIHCAASSKTDEDAVSATTKYAEMVSTLENEEVLIGHNIIRYDVPVCKRLLGLKPKGKLVDTLALSWYLFPDKIRHGLEAWGEEFGVEKPKIEDWENLTPEEYCHRCKEDVKINKRLWEYCWSKLVRIYGDEEAIWKIIDHLMAKMDLMREKEENPILLDKELCIESLRKLEEDHLARFNELKRVMPPIVKKVKKTRPAKPFKMNGEHSETGKKWFALLKEKGLPKDYNGIVEVDGEVIEPNPNSVDQLKAWLFSLGWEPDVYKFVRNKETGETRQVEQVLNPKDKGGGLSASVLLLAEEHPEINVLDGYGMIGHRIGVFKGLLDSVDENGYVQSRVAGLTNTLREKHAAPIVNLPGLTSPWGEQIRGSLICPKGNTICGTDLASLEDRCKQHWIQPLDPKYVAEMQTHGFDPHLNLAVFAGKVTKEEYDFYGKWSEVEDAPPDVKKEVKRLKNTRKAYKTVNYAATYSVGAKTLSRTSGLPERECTKLLEAFWKRNWAVLKVVEKLKIKKIGDERWMLNPVNNFYYSLRSDKDKFSTLNQGLGAYVADVWFQILRKRGCKIRMTYHDECLFYFKEGKDEQVKKIMADVFKELNDTLKLNVEMGYECQTGKRYSDCH